MSERGLVEVFVGGEGNNEVGNWRGRVQEARGVIQAILTRVRVEGWQVQRVVLWKHIRKYRAGDHRTAEQRNVLGLALVADEADSEVLAFCRDAADVHDSDDHYRAAIELARALFPDLLIVGGLAKPTIEGWILA